MGTSSAPYISVCAWSQCSARASSVEKAARVGLPSRSVVIMWMLVVRFVRASSAGSAGTSRIARSGYTWNVVTFDPLVVSSRMVRFAVKLPGWGNVRLAAAFHGSVSPRRIVLDQPSVSLKVSEVERLPVGFESIGLNWTLQLISWVAYMGLGAGATKA